MSSNLRISLSPQAKCYMLIWFGYLIPLTCLKTSLKSTTTSRTASRSTSVRSSRRPSPRGFPNPRNHPNTLDGNNGQNPRENSSYWMARADLIRSYDSQRKEFRVPIFITSDSIEGPKYAHAKHKNEFCLWLHVYVEIKKPKLIVSNKSWVSIDMIEYQKT